ncbi:sialic acid-binding Ig-like lectin 13 [Globicephala melas]|uniref:sialic acid-binding Ig-like lectin 13 n=1 Tax=Globicephala melas TaxID=9731 RepID=UPI003872BD02
MSSEDEGRGQSGRVAPQVILTAIWEAAVKIPLLFLVLIALLVTSRRRKAARPAGGVSDANARPAGGASIASAIPGYPSGRSSSLLSSLGL